MTDQPSNDEGQADDVAEDDGVLDVADSLLTDDLDADELDTGVDAGDRYRGATAFGTTAEEERQGESLDQLLAEEEPDQNADDDDWTDEDKPSDEDEDLEPRSGRLVAPDEGTLFDEEADLVADDVGIDGGAASAEEAAVHLTDDPDYT